jgi:hypothetical protein
MQTKVINYDAILNDSNLTTEEVLTLIHPNYLTMVQNGRVIKLWSILVTPELAKLILAKNKQNRPLNKTNLLYLKNEALSGRWKEVSDSIQITSEDLLNNGQHRLTVIKDLKIPLSLRIETNVDPTTFTVIDTGKKRDGVDVLSIKHVENASVTATTIRFIKFVENGYSGHLKVSNQDMVEFIDKNPSLVDSIKFGVSYYKKGNKVVTAPLLATMHFFLKKNYQHKGEEFLIKLALGNNIEPNCPSGSLRNRFISIKTEKHVIMRSEFLLQFMIVAWNKYISGEKIKAIKLPNEIPALIM